MKKLCTMILLFLLQDDVTCGAEKKMQDLQRIVNQLENYISDDQIDQIEKTLDQIARTKHEKYQPIYDQLFVIKVDREENSCCVWWPWRSSIDRRLEVDKIERLQSLVRKALQEQSK